MISSPQNKHAGLQIHDNPNHKYAGPVMSPGHTLFPGRTLSMFGININRA